MYNNGGLLHFLPQSADSMAIYFEVYETRRLLYTHCVTSIVSCVCGGELLSYYPARGLQ